MKAYLEANKERFLEELFELLRIPSISTDPSHAPDLIKAANYVKEKLVEAGVDKAEICQTKGYPVVYAEKMYASDAPTVLASLNRLVPQSAPGLILITVGKAPWLTFSIFLKRLMASILVTRFSKHASNTFDTT